MHGGGAGVLLDAFVDVLALFLHEDEALLAFAAVAGLQVIAHLVLAAGIATFVVVAFVDVFALLGDRIHASAILASVRRRRRSTEYRQSFDSLIPHCKSVLKSVGISKAWSTICTVYTTVEIPLLEHIGLARFCPNNACFQFSYCIYVHRLPHNA